MSRKPRCGGNLADYIARTRRETQTKPAPIPNDRACAECKTFRPLVGFKRIDKRWICERCQQEALKP